MKKSFTDLEKISEKISEKLQVSICNTMSISNNTSTSTSINTNEAEDPSVQDLMGLLRDQSKIIFRLQRTIEDLNLTIKSLNDKIGELEATKNLDKEVDKEVFKNVFFFGFCMFS